MQIESKQLHGDNIKIKEVCF